MATQEGSFIQITTELPFDTLLLASVSGEEALSRPFRYKVTMLCANRTQAFDPAQMNGMRVEIGVLRPGTSFDYFFRSGFLRNFQVLDVQSGFRAFRGEVVPWTAFMTLSTNFRIFQDKTVVEILRKVFEEAAALPPCNKLGSIRPFDLSSLEQSAAQSPERYPKLEYCVQCRETNFDFTSRLMEEYGIFYYFEHLGGGHTLVLRDGMHFVSDALQHDVGFKDKLQSGQELDGVVTDWTHLYDMVTGAWDLGNFSFTDPPFPIQGDGSPRPTKPPNPYRRFYFPEQVFSQAEGDARAKQQQEEDEVQVHLVTFSNENCVTFLPGFRFRLNPDGNDDHPNEKTATYLLTSQQWKATERSYIAGGLANVFLTDVTGLWTWDNQKALWFGGVASNQGQNVPGWLTDSPHIYKLWNDVIGQLLAWGLGGILAQIPQAIAKVFEDFLGSAKGKRTFSSQCIAQPSTLTFRPPRATPKPRIYGPHIALVVGQEGLHSPQGNDLCTDQFGRVRVKFPWDREHDLTDGETSAWIRVAEPWAGNQWGFQFPPRIGQEVVVDFIDGDPDRPIITGRVYNGVSRQPFHPPDKPGFSDLKGEPTPANPNFKVQIQTTQRCSGIETRSTPMPQDEKGNRTGKIGYHLLRFDDDYGNEQLLLRSQGRMDVTAKSSSYQTTEGDRHVLCLAGKDKQGNTVGGSSFMTTGSPFFGVAPKGNYDLHIGGDRFEQVDGPTYGYQLTVKKDMQLDVEQNCSGIVKGTLSLNASSIVLEAKQKITLRVGQSTLVLTPSTHYLDGPMICKQQDGPADPVPDLTFQNVVDATKADPGEPANTRVTSSAGGGGKRDSHQVKALHGTDCTMDSDNMVCVDLPQLCTADGDGE